MEEDDVATGGSNCVVGGEDVLTGGVEATIVHAQPATFVHQSHAAGHHLDSSCHFFMVRAHGPAVIC
jgi:hypothetical protein